MAPKSILDLDVAVARLERMQEDHAQLAELIGKLKQIRGVLEVKVADADRLRQKADQQLAEANKVLSDLKKAQSQLDHQAKAKLKQVDDALETASHLVSAAISKAAAQQKRWEEKQQKAFNGFREQHVSALEQVTKSYGRMRVTYDALKMSAEGLESEVEGIKKSTDDTKEQLISSLSKALQELRTEIDDSRSAAEKVATEQMEELGRHITEYVSKVESSFNEKLEEVQTESAGLRKRAKVSSIVQAVLAILVLASLAAGIAALLNYRFW